MPNAEFDTFYIGLQKEPKWGHLRDLHHALKLSRKPLLWGSYSFKKLGKHVEVRNI